MDPTHPANLKGTLAHPREVSNEMHDRGGSHFSDTLN